MKLLKKKKSVVFIIVCAEESVHNSQEFNAACPFFAEKNSISSAPQDVIWTEGRILLCNGNCKLFIVSKKHSDLLPQKLDLCL